MSPRLRYLSLLALALAACAPAPDTSAPPPQAGPTPKDPPAYAGQGTVYDTQFKALHDAKQLGTKLNEDVGRNIDANVDPAAGTEQPPQ